MEENEEENEMEENELVIRVSRLNKDGVLDGFPYLEDQYADGCIDEGIDEYARLVVNLGNHQDTTTAQEQFLNTKSAVLEYNIHWS